jgi:hypothetical protein
VTALEFLMNKEAYGSGFRPESAGFVVDEEAAKALQDYYNEVNNIKMNAQTVPMMQPPMTNANAWEKIHTIPGTQMANDEAARRGYRMISDAEQRMMPLIRESVDWDKAYRWRLDREFEAASHRIPNYAPPAPASSPPKETPMSKKMKLGSTLAMLGLGGALSYGAM